MAKFQHQFHPVDQRRTIGGYHRTACGRWAGILGFFKLPQSLPCPKCAVAEVIRETAPEASV